MRLHPEDFPPGAMEYARSVAASAGGELTELVDMYSSMHPETIEMVGRRIGQMSEQRRIQLLVLAVALLSDDGS